MFFTRRNILMFAFMLILAFFHFLFYVLFSCYMKEIERNDRSPNIVVWRIQLIQETEKYVWFKWVFLITLTAWLWDDARGKNEKRMPDFEINIFKNFVRRFGFIPFAARLENVFSLKFLCYTVFIFDLVIIFSVSNLIYL